MKNILFVLLVILSLNADEFKFDPKIDSINDLKRFCSKNKHGVDFGDKATRDYLCDKYVEEAVLYYNEECDKNNIEACLSVSNIYAFGLGKVKENDDKALEIYEKVCNLKDKFGCHISALVYLNKSNNTNDKNQAKAFKNKAKMYYKESCKLGNEWDCKEAKKL